MKYDVAVIGGGPAGLSASIFTTRAELKTICFERLAIGGQASLSYDIANYPAFESISGFDLCQKMYSHAEATGTEFSFEKVENISEIKGGFEIKTTDNIYYAKKVIIACGNKAKKLNLKDELRFIGRGVSYCASCDGRFFKGKPVAIVGGGDSAFEYVDYLSKLASKIYLLNRSEKFRAGASKVKKAKRYKNVEILTNANILSLNGKERLENVLINHDGEEKILNVEGVFVAIGHEPDLSFLDFEIEKDSAGYILVDQEMRTSKKNVFACGDILSKHFKQVITACADGAIAGNSCIGD
ncbi:MAG: FAD-binding protein [Clostridiales bacterium]|nr:FAD-binding protein [Clostridiales bacterium]